MDIRKININDLDNLIEIENRLYKSPWNKNSYKSEILENKYSYIYLLVENNNIIGYIGFWLVNDYATITKVSIDTKYQGLGYSKKLMEFLIHFLISKNATVVDLEVRESNIKAINLYKSYNFEIVSVRKKYYSDGEDALMMVLKLKEGEDYEKIHISN